MPYLVLIENTIQQPPFLLLYFPPISSLLKPMDAYLLKISYWFLVLIWADAFLHLALNLWSFSHEKQLTRGRALIILERTSNHLGRKLVIYLLESFPRKNYVQMTLSFYLIYFLHIAFWTWLIEFVWIKYWFYFSSF